MRILIVEDNEAMSEGMSQVLVKCGHEVSRTADASQALTLLEKRKIDLVISDYRLPGMDGLEFLQKSKSRRPDLEFMMITAYGTIELAVNAMKAGAWDFIPKPFDKETLKLKVDRAAEMIGQKRRARALEEENRYLREEMADQFSSDVIIGKSDVMQDVFRMIDKVAVQDSTVFISGESGTGKELVARAIHGKSGRRNRPFIRLNCGALAEGVLESELFGHEKGSFTGAVRQKKGRFELAHTGTLFLDEIGDIPLTTQVKLLRVIQEKEFERVGGEETLAVDVRLIAATHRNLPAAVKDGTFREDLYYRLHILPIRIPPLRERSGDIPVLAGHILKRLSRETGKPDVSLTRQAMDILESYPWPGNVREFENVLERAVVLCEGDRIDREDLLFLRQEARGTDVALSSLNLDAEVTALEMKIIRESMVRARGVKARAAAIMGIKEGVLYYKLKKYGLLGEDEKA
ncbi:sigma-54-dependent Fis family transcriptional regulator [bacterium]|nr:sigma-54-dependent Fis family transcriptional regulator [bacterium]